MKFLFIFVALLSLLVALANSTAPQQIGLKSTKGCESLTSLKHSTQTRSSGGKRKLKPGKRPASVAKQLGYKDRKNKPGRQAQGHRPGKLTAQPGQNARP
jgi:hypothetical protein